MRGRKSRSRGESLEYQEDWKGRKKSGEGHQSDARSLGRGRPGSRLFVMGAVDSRRNGREAGEEPSGDERTTKALNARAMK